MAPLSPAPAEPDEPRGRSRPTMALRVWPLPASQLPGDVSRDLLPDQSLRLEPAGPGRATLVGPASGDGTGDRGADRRAILFGTSRQAGQSADGSGAQIVEVVVDGWRFELAVEDAARADLRDRARRDRGDASAGGPVQIRAMIPGRVLSVSVAIGDRVAADQQVLVLEAMKMQNEVRAPAGGVVEGIGVGPGQTVELGDLLLTLGPVGDAR